MTDEDLKARLRDGVPCFDPDAVNDEGSFYIDDANETMCEAADAIERLEADNARLRAKLENIASQQQVHEMTAWDREHADFDEAYDLIIYEARAALAGKDEQ